MTVPLSAASEDRILELVLEAGGEEFATEGEHFVITTAPERLYAVGDALKNAGVTAENLKLTFIPENTVAVVEESTAAQVIRLCDALEACEDVQNVHANFDIPEDLIARLPA